MQTPQYGKKRCRDLSVVIPVLNEEAVLPLLWSRLETALNSLDVQWKVVFVDDGSTDSTASFLLSLASNDGRVGVLVLSRNFGHQRAITAGLACATGQAVVVMDGDLQDPPEVISELLKEYQNGADIVYAKRRLREGETWFKKVTAVVFYRVMRFVTGLQIPIDVGDFRLMADSVVKTLNGMPEQHRFMRGMVAWTGFRSVTVAFDRDKRAAGVTKFGLLRMMRFAWDGITSFTALPVRLGLSLGFVLLGVSFMYGLYVLFVRFVTKTTVQGWTTIVLLQLLFSGLIFLYLGVIGDYVGRIYEQGKGRPLYVVRTRKNL